MTLRGMIVTGVGIGVLTGISAACSSDSGDAGCSADADCANPRICVDRACVDPPANTGGSEPKGMGEGGTGGIETGGTVTGGVGAGGISDGGTVTGGVETGGMVTGGVETGGMVTGGVETGGVETGGIETGGTEPGCSVTGQSCDTNGECCDWSTAITPATVCLSNDTGGGECTETCTDASQCSECCIPLSEREYGVCGTPEECPSWECVHGAAYLCACSEAAGGEGCSDADISDFVDCCLEGASCSVFNDLRCLAAQGEPTTTAECVAMVEACPI